MSKECKKCRNSVAEVSRRGRCYSPDPDDNSKCMLFKPMTNGDRIRAMTDEELADFLSAMSACGIDCPACEYCQATKIVSCLLTTLGWLREPVKEDAE